MKKELSEEDRILKNTLIVRALIKEANKPSFDKYEDVIVRSIAFNVMRIDPKELADYLKTATPINGSLYPVMVKWVMDDLKGGEFNLTNQYMFGMFSMATIDFNVSSLTLRIAENKVVHMLGGKLFLAQIEQVDPNTHMIMDVMYEDKEWYKLLRFIASHHRNALKKAFNIMDNIEYFRKTLKMFEKMTHYQNVSLLKDMGD